MSNLLSKAALAIETTAQKYEPVYGLHYPVFIDQHGDYIKEVEDEDLDSICTNCVSDGAKALREKFDAGLLKCEGAARLELWPESAPETCDFVLCDCCGEYISTSVLHTFSQEINHWTNIVTDEDFARQVDLPRDVWPMFELLIKKQVK